MNSISFTAYGVPQPKGSTKSFGFIVKGKTTKRGTPLVRTVTTSDNDKNKGWQQLVAEAAQLALSLSPERFELALREPVYLSIQFYLPRPKSLPKKWQWHVTRPDLDKLSRSVKDALTKVLWNDDGQVVSIVATKGYAQQSEQPRAVITVSREKGA